MARSLTLPEENDCQEMAQTDLPPTVTVGITAYNRPAMVRRAIESVLRQSGVEFEIVVVDDGSGDETPAVIREMADSDRRIRPVFHEVNRGVNAAKNSLFDYARGQFTLFLDSDDELLPDALSAFVDAFHTAGPAYGMIVMNCVDSVSGSWTGRGLQHECDVSYAEALSGRMSGQFSGMWRTCLIGSLRFAENEAAFENTLWLQLYRKGKVRYFPKVTKIYYTDTPGSVVSLRFDQQSAARRLAAVRSHLNEFGEDMKSFRSPRLAALNRELVLFANLAGERSQALRGAMRLLFSSKLGWLFLMASFLPRQVFAWMARRYYSGQGAKVA